MKGIKASHLAFAVSAVVATALVGSFAVMWLVQSPSLEEKAQRYLDAAAPDGRARVIDCVRIERDDHESVPDGQWCEVEADARVPRFYPAAQPIYPGRSSFCFSAGGEKPWPYEPAERPQDCA